MKCQKVKKRLVLIVGNDLPKRKKKFVVSHLEQCPSCMKELEELKNMKKNVRFIAQKDIPDRLHPGFAEKVVQQIAEEQEFIPFDRAKFPIWLFQHPVRMAGIVVLAFILIATTAIFFLFPGKAPSERLAEKILSISDTGSIGYIIDYCGQGRNLSSYKGYSWIQQRMRRLISRTGSRENVYIAVFLMPNSSRQERRQIEEALLKTFNPYFNRGV